MNRRPSRLFLGSLIGFAVAAAVLILTIPALFGPHEAYQVWLTACLGGLSLALGALVISLRPPRGTAPQDPNQA